MINYVKAGECIVEKIVDELSIVKDISKACVILPTRRLSNYVCLRLTEKQKQGASWYPNFYSIEEFVSQYAQSKTVVIDEMSSEMVLGGIILDGVWKYLRPGLESELLVFFNSAIESESDVFAEITKVLNEDVYRSVKGAERLLEMTLEISKCLTLFEATLKDAGMVLPVRQLKNAVQDFKGIDLVGKEIIVAGFTTIRPVLLPALKKLVGVSKLIFNEPFDLISSVSPLLEMISSLGGKVIPKALEIRSDIELFECRDITAEIELLINWLKELLQAGVKPSSIGVLIADEESYGPLLQKALKHENIKANISLPINVGRTPLGEVFKSVASLIPHEASVLHIAILAMHPLLAAKKLDQGLMPGAEILEKSRHSVEPVPSDDSETLQASENLPSNQPHDQTKKKGKNKIKEIASFAEQEFDERHRISSYLAGEIDFHVRPQYAVSQHFWENKLKQLCQTFGLHLPPQPLTQWHDFMADLLDQLEPEELENEQDKKASMREARKSILHAISKASRMIFVNFSPGEFWDLISNKVLLSEIRTVGYPLEGVQVLSIKEARHVPFDYIFIPGMLEGIFPAKLPRDTLIEDWLKRKAKIQSWSYVEAMEDTTFGLMLQRTPSLSLSWPREVEGRESVRSRFVERLKALGNPFHVYRGARFKLFGEAEVIPEAVVMEASNELTSSPLNPSRIESLLACPWQFYLSSNGVRYWDLLENEEDYISEGNWIHKVVESFLNAKSSQLDFAETETEQQILKSIIELADEKRKFFEVSQSFYLHMKLKGWPLLAKHFKAMFKGWKGGQRELKLADDAKIEVGDHSLKVRGKIDSIEKFSWGNVIIDFKRSSMPTVAEVSKGIKPQIAIYAAVLGMDQAALVYWSLKLSNPLVVAANITMDSSWISETSMRKLSSPKDAYDKFKEHLLWRLSQPKVYPDVGKICKDCKFMSSCRKTDPRLSTQLESMAEWEKRLDDLKSRRS